jgi:hypothetical protein
MKYEELSREKLIEIVKAYSEGIYADIYSVGMYQLKELAKEFKKHKIDVKSGDGDRLFANFMVYMEKSKKIADTLEEIQKKIDPVIMSKIKNELIKSRDFSPEEISLNLLKK